MHVCTKARLEENATAVSILVRISPSRSVVKVTHLASCGAHTSTQPLLKRRTVLGSAGATPSLSEVARDFRFAGVGSMSWPPKVDARQNTSFTTHIPARHPSLNTTNHISKRTHIKQHAHVTPFNTPSHFVSHRAKFLSVIWVGTRVGLHGTRLGASTG